MSAPRPSAVDCITPAVDRAKWLLLNPFRWSVWWRLAVVALATSGELIGNSFRIPDLINATRQNKELVSVTDVFSPALIALLVVLGLTLIVVHLYVSSVMRFIMFDAVSTGQYRLRIGWKRWHSRGVTLFLLQLIMLAIALVPLTVVIGLPVAMIIKGGHSSPAMVGGILLLIPVVFVLILVAYVVFSLVFDFTVPVIALEDPGPTGAWSRMWQIVRNAKGEFAGYFGMKFVLSLVVGFAVGILQLILLIPVFILVVAAAVGATAAMPDLWKNPLVLAIVITVGMVGLLIFAFLLGLLQVPVAVFLQSYAVTFFSARYPLLWQLLYPAHAQPAPEAPPTVLPEEPPPLPAM